MKVANIVYENELVNHKQVSYINYVKYDSDDYFDILLPTLYVGWGFLKKQYSHLETFRNIDILDKTIIKNKTYWEFSFEENKSEHINGVVDFVNGIPKVYFSTNFMYENINPIFHNIKDLTQLYDKLPNSFDVFYNYKNEMLYLLTTNSKFKHNQIFGIDLTLYTYFQLGVEELIKHLRQLSKDVFDDLDGEKSKQLLTPFNSSHYFKKYLPIFLYK